MITWSNFCAWYAKNATSIPKNDREKIRTEAIERRYARMAGERLTQEGYADLVEKGENAMGGQ
jgi:hypothetical protein